MGSEPTAHALGFDGFAERLRPLTVVDGEMRREDRLREDLGFDSISLLLCLDAYEEAAGRPVDERAVIALETVGDAYALYLRLVGVG
jgi:acyl carrier protein